MVGTFGDLGTVSFYPAHHITMGEGGCVSDQPPASARRWPSRSATGDATAGARPGKDNTCGKRFDWQLGDLPYGYDHKYIYSHIGYNLKATDMQAAVGVAQLEKLDGFVARPPAQLRALYDGSERLGRAPDPAGGHASLRSELVRLSDRRREGVALLPRPSCRGS